MTLTLKILPEKTAAAKAGRDGEGAHLLRNNFYLNENDNSDLN